MEKRGGRVVDVVSFFLLSPLWGGETGGGGSSFCFSRGAKTSYPSFPQPIKPPETNKLPLFRQYPEKQGGGEAAQPQFLRLVLSSAPPLLFEAFGAYTIFPKAKPRHTLLPRPRLWVAVFRRHLGKRRQPLFFRNTIAIAAASVLLPLLSARLRTCRCRTNFKRLRSITASPP